MIRVIDLLISLIVIVLMTIPLLFAALIIWLNDLRSPLYIAKRIGVGGEPFNMYKLRTMIVEADSSGVESTASNDERITRVGSVIRKLKLDEFPQFLNVLSGQMSVVGPRPNTETEVMKYNDYEKKLLTVKPGITDFASIIFYNEAEILAANGEAEAAYDKIIRPIKSALGVFYVENRNTQIDLMLIFYTFYSLFGAERVRSQIMNILENLEFESKSNLSIDDLTIL